MRDAVIYELHIGTFTDEGTFAAAVQRLDHLVELGVTHVELMPVAQWSGSHGWGYDGVNLFAAHAAYGGPYQLRELIDRCHAKQLAVIIDVVHNHFGPDGAYHLEIAPYRTGQHQTPWGDAVNLDGEHAGEVRRFLIDSALMWLGDYGADGLRLDAIHALCDESAEHFIAELTGRVRALEADLDRNFVLIGEYDDHEPHVVMPRAQQGWGLDAHWNDDFHHAVHSLLSGEAGGYYADFADRGTLAKVLRDGYALDGGHSGFRGVPHGKAFGTLTRDHLVAYIQSHDQVGNRAAGERLHQLIGADKAMIAAAILLVSPFVPMLFQGEEWAASSPFCYFVDFESPELQRAVREGRKAEHAASGWLGETPDPTDPQTRASSVLVWNEIDRGAHASMLAWYRRLLQIRREHADLRDPSPTSTSYTDQEFGFRITRGNLSLVVNLSEADVPLEAATVLASSKPMLRTLSLPPLACAVLRTSP